MANKIPDFAGQDSTVINFEATREKAVEITECRNYMEGLFNSFSDTARTLLNEGFVGMAADEFELKQNELKNTFDKYLAEVDYFSSVISGAATSTEEAEKKIVSNAEDLYS